MDSVSENKVIPISIEKHFSPKQIAELWSFDEDTVRDLFRGEPGVLRLERRATRGKRAYMTMRVPASVVARVHRRMEAVAA